MTMRQDITYCAARKRGFNLVEAAIVLGVIGLVIGGIWVAASAVNRNLRVNQLMSDVALVINGMQKLIPRSEYPNSGGDRFVTDVAQKIGALPASYAVTNTYYPVGTAPSGITIAVTLEVFGYLAVEVYGNAVSQAECMNIIAHALRGKNSSFVSAAVERSSPYFYMSYDATSDPRTISCPSTFDVIYLRYQPN